MKYLKHHECLRRAALPALALGMALSVHAQQADQSTTPQAQPHAGATAPAGAMSHAMRASEVIGHDVRGTDDKNVGEIKDLIVNMQSGAVRYAILEFDPGILKSEKLFAVPLKDLAMSADGKQLTYKSLSRDRLEKAGVDKADWKKALDNRRYIDGLDKNYGVSPPTGDARSFRASDLIGKDVNSRQGNDIGDIKDLMLDMQGGKVDYAVLAFDPSWFKGEKLFAFGLNAFTLTDGKDELMLDVDKKKLESMKSFDSKRWGSLNALNRDEYMNPPPHITR